MGCLKCQHPEFGFYEIKEHFYGNRKKISKGLCDVHFQEYQKEFIKINNESSALTESDEFPIIKCNRCEFKNSVFKRSNGKCFCTSCHKKFRVRSKKELNCTCREICFLCGSRDMIEDDDK